LGGNRRRKRRKWKWNLKEIGIEKIQAVLI
jgi:hypothetical protein